MTIIATADGSNVTFALMLESSLAALPGTPHFTKKRHTGANFEPNFTLADNGEIVDNKQHAGDSLVALDGSGSIPFQLIIGEYGDLERAAILGAAAVTSTITGTADVAFTAATKTIVLSGAAAGGFANAMPGEVILIAAAAIAANNGFKTIETVVDNDTITVVETLADDTAESPTIKLSKITNGTTRTSFLCEMGYPDISTFRLIQGIVPTGWNFTADKKSIVSGAFPCLAISEAPADASIENSTYVAATTAEPVNSTSQLHTTRLRKYNADGTHDAALACSFSKIAVTVTNGARFVDGVAEGLFPINVGTGPVKVEVACTAYFRDKNLFLAALNSDSLTLSFGFTDLDGNSKFVTIPKTKLRQPKYSTPANASDCTVDFVLKGQIDNFVTQKSIIVSTHLVA